MNPKQAVAEYGAGLVRSGMVLGLGSGSTATLMVQAIGEKLRAGTLRDVIGVPSSSAIAAVATAAGVPLTTLDAHPVLDLDLDGADEVDPHLNLIKGLGGALLWEKIVATAARELVILVDDSKLVPILGSKAPLPVEVVPFGWKAQRDFLSGLGGTPVLRTRPDGQPYVTDEGNYILDTRFAGIADPAALERQLLLRAGVVATGLFLGMARQIVVGKAGGIEVLRRD
ncbi:MAG TPA: ribose-5-phosphate isomerase RpiA [Candidatus Baltobacteraceae bacterium]|nr:ribose-5-phosphate isomerase RpiA [Candidatus Baltobacteraceae bacterium]